MPIHVNPFPINDGVPDSDEIAAAVRRLKRNKAPGPSGFTTDVAKDWLLEATKAEDPITHRWDLLVELIQTVFETRTIPHAMAWAIIVLLPKPDGGVRGIGLLETTWKIIKAIIESRVKAAVKFHDCLHGCIFGCGTGTATIESKLVQQLAGADFAPLFKLHLDLKKAFDTMDREKALEIFAAYGMGPRLIELLSQHWEMQRLAA